MKLVYGDVEQIELPKKFENNSENLYWAYTIKIDSKVMTADKLAKKLLASSLLRLAVFLVICLLLFE